MTESARVRVRAVKTLSDDWYVLKKTTFDYLRRDGTWQTQNRETYDRGNGAAILLYNRSYATVVLTRQFRFPAYVNGLADGMMIEVCAGIMDEDDPEACIRREAEEEAGFVVHNPRKVFEASPSERGPRGRRPHGGAARNGRARRRPHARRTRPSSGSIRDMVGRSWTTCTEGDTAASGSRRDRAFEARVRSDCARASARSTSASRPGEVVGIAGLMGFQAAARSLHLDHGRPREARRRSDDDSPGPRYCARAAPPTRSVDAGVGLVPEDRKAQALCSWTRRSAGTSRSRSSAASPWTHRDPRQSARSGEEGFGRRSCDAWRPSAVRRPSSRRGRSPAATSSA